MPPALTARPYVPRDPSAGVLQPLVRRWRPALEHAVEGRGRGLPAFVEAALDRFCACGHPEHGVIHLRCGSCGAEHALAFHRDELAPPARPLR